MLFNKKVTSKNEGSVSETVSSKNGSIFKSEVEDFSNFIQGQVA